MPWRKPVAINNVLARSRMTLFDDSAIPFCSWMYAAVVSHLIPSKSATWFRSLFLTSPPPSENISIGIFPYAVFILLIHDLSASVASLLSFRRVHHLILCLASVIIKWCDWSNKVDMNFIQCFQRSLSLDSRDNPPRACKLAWFTVSHLSCINCLHTRQYALCEIEDGTTNMTEPFMPSRCTDLWMCDSRSIRIRKLLTI